MTEITTSAELEALPVGSVVLDGDRDAWQRCSDTTRQDEDGQYMSSAWACPAWTSDRTSREVIEGGRISGLHVAPARLPITVLFRPDVPQPATGDDAYTPASWISPAHAAGYLTGAMGHISGSPHITPELLSRARTMARHVLEAADYLEGTL